MNKEMAVKKINTIGKVGNIIARIVRILLLIGFVGAVIGGITMLCIPDDLFRFDLSGEAKLDLNLKSADLSGRVSEAVEEAMKNADVSIGNSRYATESVDINQDGTAVTFNMKGEGGLVTPKRVSVLLWMAAVYIVISYIMMFIIGNLCKALQSCRSPFEDGIIKSMQQLAWSLIPFALIDTTMSSVVANAFNSNISVSFGLDLTTILFILLIFGLAYIFKYGAILQTESDETL
ncbi:MAG: DUF2975 domain-containing protein [Lachnospiraceae bacterium]|nr:DUF2975 domain-containing protein [Lachnospiraceae bacterium]